MKNVKLIGCILMAMVGTSPLMAASCDTSSGKQIVNLLSLSDSEIQDFTEGNLQDSILECAEGTCLPLYITVKGEFLKIESTDALHYLKVMKPCYVRCEEKEHFLFSTDLQDWEEFSEFFTGELSVSVRNKNGAPAAELMLELNQKKPF